AETRGRSRELIAGGRHERQIVLALSNDRMFLAAATVGCRPSACASPAIPKQVGHNHLGFSCRQHARCRPAGDCRSAEPELGPTSPGSNHPGAAGSIASRIAADSPPDGYTLYMPVLSTFVSLPGAAPNLPIQLPRDFTAIGFAAENPMFIVVTPS